MLRRCNHRYRTVDRVRPWVLGFALSACACATVAQTRALLAPHVAVSVAVEAPYAVNVPSLTAAQQAEFARAEAAAQKILAGAEYQERQPTLWDRIKSKILDFIIRIFVGIDRVTTQSPWVGRTLEWLLFLGAAAGLMAWMMRMVQRQRLRVALGGEPAKSAAWARETEDWRRQADEDAARGAWREAIHAVYWAAIVLLEQRRAWRHNPARTPREYVRLLKAGSPEQRELRGLTSALEENWYGQREADAEKFGEARQSFERLADSSDTPEPVSGGKA